jgi:hypothetical protein
MTIKTIKLSNKLLIGITIIAAVVSLFSLKSVQRFIDLTDLLVSKYPNHLEQESKTIFNKALTTATSQSDDYVAIITRFTINPTNRDSSYSIQAFAKITNNGTPIDVGHLNIGNTIIDPDSDNLYHYTFQLADGKALFGTSQDVSFSSYSTRTLRIASQVLIVPKEFYPSSISLPSSTIDRTTDYHLTWAADPNNEFGKVQIQVKYDKGISQYSASGMPNSINDLVYNVSDNGTFTIPHTDLSRYPQNSYVTISIARAWLDSSAAPIEYVSIMDAESVPLLVVEPNPNTMSINGPNLVCTSGNYSVNNLPSGLSVTWSMSPTGIGNLSCTNCQQTTLSNYSAGNITLTANVHNSSKSTLITKAVHIGGYGSGDYPVSGPSTANCNGYVTYTTNSLPGATNYTWFYPGDWTYVDGQGTTSLTLIAKGTSGYKQIGVRVANACDAGGSYAIKNTYFTGCSGGYYVVAPNPATSTVTINSSSDNLASVNTASSTIPHGFSEINIYDELGNLKLHKTYNKVRSARINVSNLPTGIYTIEIIEGSYKETEKLQVLK